MRPLLGRGARVPAEVVRRAGLPRGAGVLASARADGGTWLLGTRDALVVVPPELVVDAGRGVERERLVEPVETLTWERVATADWDRDVDRLRVVEVADFGAVPPTHTFVVPDAGRFLELVRERVTASVLLQRRVSISGKRGLTVIGRRPPRGNGETIWAVELDPGLSPDDPAVQHAAARGLEAAQSELGFV